MKLTILDDYLGVALKSADWSVLAVDVAVLRQHVEGDQLIAALADSDVVFAIRERTRFPAEVLAKLPRLKLLVTTGARSAAIDPAACQRQGIVVSGTVSQPFAAAELTWALTLAVSFISPRFQAIDNRGRPLVGENSMFTRTKRAFHLLFTRTRKALRSAPIRSSLTLVTTRVCFWTRRLRARSY